MVLRKVLQIGTYPIHQRLSGGQRRVGAIRDGYERAGVTVCSISVCDQAAYPSAAQVPGNFFAGPEIVQEIRRSPYLMDLICGANFALDRSVCAPLVRLWNQFQPDIIELEQCYAWPGVKHLLDKKMVPARPILYSSQNYETEMKKRMYNLVMQGSDLTQAVDLVYQTEKDLVAAADLTIAVSEDDANAFRTLGATNLVVVHNGSDHLPVDPHWCRKWRNYFDSIGVRSYLFFVSSNHLPNYIGFEHLAGTTFAYLPPDSRIVVAGSVCEHLIQQPAFRDAESLGRSRLLPLGSIADDGELSGLIQEANAILLPIIDGGGSNIKTVEALLSGRPIIASPFAFRSFETFAHLNRVTVCAEPRDFQRAIQDHALRSYQPTLPLEPGIELYTWPHLGSTFARTVIDQFQSGF